MSFLKNELRRCSCLHISSQHLRPKEVFTNFFHGLRVTEIDNYGKNLHRTMQFSCISDRYNKDRPCKRRPYLSEICYALDRSRISLYQFAHPGDLHIRTNHLVTSVVAYERSDCSQLTASFQIARFTWPTWGPPVSCRPRVGPMLAQWTLLAGMTVCKNDIPQPEFPNQKAISANWIPVNLTTFTPSPDLPTWLLMNLHFRY